MSKRHDIQDATGIISRYGPAGVIESFGFGAPTASAKGYAIGSIYMDITNGHLYINQGSLTSATWVQVDAGTALAGLLATAAEINRSSQLSTSLVAVAAATTTLTLTVADHDKKTILLASTGGLAITPPAAVGSGALFTFVFTATISGGNVTIDAKAGNASDVFSGRAYQLKVGTGEVVYAAGSTDNLLTFDGTTRGGLKGDRVIMKDVATNMWQVEISQTATGTVATPFSNH